MKYFIVDIDESWSEILLHCLLKELLIIQIYFVPVFKEEEHWSGNALICKESGNTRKVS